MPALSSVIARGSGYRLEAYLQHSNIWNAFPARVDHQHNRQTGFNNVSPVSLLAVSDGQIMRVQLWVKVFMRPQVCPFLWWISNLYGMFWQTVRGDVVMMKQWCDRRRGVLWVVGECDNNFLSRVQQQEIVTSFSPCSVAAKLYLFSLVHIVTTC